MRVFFGNSSSSLVHLLDASTSKNLAFHFQIKKGEKFSAL
ncbi:hypothetical protein HMPREF1557_00257 [Streptococcus sobrinus W1703]|uniref:Uncharacterized protein n=1 Tax=Streptococcus sobrinus W1703 TaxID=1227275 RepID=U2KMM4_9STRE|nr:hypothetical protein HMPREF1557_00257 [Streptococcus sobrinus W1703]